MERIKIAACCMRNASNHHRILTVIVFSGIWYTLEYVVQAHVASKVVEIFAISPFADRVVSAVFGE